LDLEEERGGMGGLGNGRGEGGARGVLQPKAGQRAGDARNFSGRVSCGEPLSSRWKRAVHAVGAGAEGESRDGARDPEGRTGGGDERREGCAGEGGTFEFSGGFEFCCLHVRLSIGWDLGTGSAVSTSARDNLHIVWV
jgi:hypothetical protein